MTDNTQGRSNHTNPLQENFLIALEGGGTRSQAAILRLDGQVLQTSQAGDVNTNFTGLEQARQAVLAAVRGVLVKSRVDGAAVTLLASALVGPRFGREVFADLLPNARFLFFRERDVVFASAGIYQPHGVGLVAATGATAFGLRADDRREVSFGGWGSLLGDEGSAYAMGLLGLRAAARAFEGREPEPTRLVDAVCGHYGFHIQAFHHELVQLAYQKPISRAEVAGLAVEVTRLAGQGDRVARRICRKVAADLANLALHTARALFDPQETFDLVAAGGMTAAGDLVLGALRRRLADEFPRAVFQIGTEPPAQALGRLALDATRSKDADRSIL